MKKIAKMPTCTNNQDLIIGDESGKCEDVKDILDEKILVRIHGSLMIVAWIGFASVGIILSR